ncbi:urease subunit alpha [Chroococcidiopsis sp. TS-821]|uniref:urease subunit alpha n=1 Tax=Chroococcidiopsis sp. TS-821 TaxID=1378066 RepID=UPI000CEE5BE7|nr:urease subunit alpha [Chroococcidiopsis sp. TS-821]PPS41907.1 urease subunit alpha [Chroococcidiopsis sp. TS-821]
MEISRERYAELFGPTVGDRIRLGDTSLVVEVERDTTVYGDECVFGGGKTLRDGLGMAAGVTASEGALDLVVTNVVLIDPVQGIVKTDVGIKNGKIAGIGKAGNPSIMDGVCPDLIVSANTDVRAGEGLIATPGGIDCHVHFDSAGLCAEALSSGVTTMLGGGLGPVTVGICSSGARNLGIMLQAAEGFPVNFGFLGKGSSSLPESLVEQIENGAYGLKIHEDWGAMPAVIDTCLSVADNYDFQVQLHTDTLNESGYVEDTLAAIAKRTIHMYHAEGAGGGHAPDIIKVAGYSHCLPSSTNPTNPYTVNTFDEHLDMVMVCHHLNPKVPEDVAFAESRIRAETIAAEDILHDIGAISMLGSDSQGMGRIGEVICRTWQLASKMKDQRGILAEDNERNDNHRILRYLAKYTINVAKTCGIDSYVGSIEPGKIADLVLWKPGFFGIKPETVIKGGFIAWAAMGESNASLMTCEPILYRPQWSSFGTACQATSVGFVTQAALEKNLPERLGLRKQLLPVRGTRSLSKADMVRNTACPEIEVDPDTFQVRVNGELATCEPVSKVPLGRLYIFR